jgi:hypothetical protein
MELIGILIGFILTLFIYSYLFGDNPLYRLAVHVLVGVSAAYAAVFVVAQVLLPIYAQIALDPISLPSLLWLIPTMMALLLIIKRLPATWLGNVPVAYLIGVGAAIALLGAIQGTLLPQIFEIGQASTAVTSLITVLFTAITLFSFQFTARKKEGDDAEWNPPAWQRGVQFAGQVLLTIMFGALFTAVLTTSLTLFIERITYFIAQLTGIL